MMGGGGRSDQAKNFALASMQRSDKAFNMGLPWLEKAIGMSHDAVSLGGETAFLGRALENSQANALDSTYLGDTSEQVAAIFGRKGAVQGGNAMQALGPETLGTKLARVIAGSETSRLNSRVAQVFDAAGVGVGQAGTAGELQSRALASQLGAISMAPKVDPTVSTIAGVAGLAGSIYGAGKQGGWWGGGSSQLQTLPISQSYTSFPGEQQRAFPTQYSYTGPPVWR